MTCQVANVLKRDGVKKGDRVAIYMPVSPLLVASMLACARLGAIHRYILKVHPSCCESSLGLNNYSKFIIL